MSPIAPQMKPLSLSSRRWVFFSMLGMFTILVPLLVLYATGYRFNWESMETSFRVVGGMYITNSSDETQIIVNDEPVQNMRIFQQAAYIQNVPEGLHEVYVQGEGVYTWVKNLPVFAQLVTEARSFNMPKVPEVRVVTRWVDPITGAGVLFESATSTSFADATTSSVLISTSTATTTSFVLNTEFTYVQSLFATSTPEEESTRSIRVSPLVPVTSSTTASSAPSLPATTTRQTSDVRLYEIEGEVYATWIGENRTRPYYYCVNYQGATSTSQLYGEHVYKQLIEQLASTTDFSNDDLLDQTLCRSTIRIDRGYSEVKMFDFVPGTTDLILMHLADGLYVVEVDDRAWQNMQLLYPGNNIEVFVDGRRIFVKDDEYYLEVFADTTR